MRVPGVVGGRSPLRLPGYVASVVAGLRLRLHVHIQVGVVLRPRPGVEAVLRLPQVDVVGVGGVHDPVSPPPGQQEALQRHRVLLGQEEGGLRQVLTRREHLPGALQVEEDPGPDGVEHVPVVLQEPVVEQTVVSDADGLEAGKKYYQTLTSIAFISIRPVS